MTLQNASVSAFLRHLNRPVSIAPLITFRIFFGFLMAIATLRFLLNGWVEELYIRPEYHFPFFGLHWIKVYGGTFMYVLFGLLLLFSLCIAIGFIYRIAATGFFLVFTYIEFIDKTYYLNHYYFIILVSFLLIFLPLNRFCALDLFISKHRRGVKKVPNWMPVTIKMQLVMVYFFAGLAKINSDWLLHALPLKIWLPPLSEVPVLGYWFGKAWVAYLLSWSGCVFDLGVGLLLWMRGYRLFAWFCLVVFHLLTGFLFPIGMFPYVMIVLTTVFFSDKWHRKIISYIKLIPLYAKVEPNGLLYTELHTERAPRTRFVFGMFFALQVLIPLRFLLYPGNVMWHEQGFRFSWRVMLMEKAGTVFFTVKDASGKTFSVINRNYLTPLQEKMVATQPDMIVDMAHLLQEDFRKKGIQPVQVFAESYVALNGRRSRLLIDPDFDLTQARNNFGVKTFITESPADLW